MTEPIITLQGWHVHIRIASVRTTVGIVIVALLFEEAIKQDFPWNDGCQEVLDGLLDVSWDGSRLSCSMSCVNCLYDIVDGLLGLCWRQTPDHILPVGSTLIGLA